MYLLITPEEVVVQRVSTDPETTLFNTSNKYMYKDLTNTSPIKVVTGPTLFNTPGSGTPQLKYTTPLKTMVVSDNGTPSGSTPTFIHFDIQ
jgi:hypothetical protein